MMGQLYRAGAKLANMAVPHQCVMCRRFAEATGLCASCWNGLAPIAAPICRRCGLPLGHTLSDPICAGCFADPPPLATIRAGLRYNDSSRKLILAFKHGDALQLAPFLAALLARDFIALADADTMVLPVPLHSRRFFRRRYNQSAELARRLCHTTGIGHYAPHLLVRRRPTASQGGLSRTQRRHIPASSPRQASCRLVEGGAGGHHIIKQQHPASGEPAARRLRHGEGPGQIAAELGTCL